MKKIFLLLLFVTQAAYARVSLAEAGTQLEKYMDAYNVSKNSEDARRALAVYEALNEEKDKRVLAAKLLGRYKLTIDQLRSKAAAQAVATKAPAAPAAIPSAPAPATAAVIPSAPPAPAMPDYEDDAQVLLAKTESLTQEAAGRVLLKDNSATSIKNADDTLNEIEVLLKRPQNAAQVNQLNAAKKVLKEALERAKMIAAPLVAVPGTLPAVASGKSKTLSPAQQAAQNLGLKTKTPASGTSLLTEAEDAALEQAVADANALDLKKTTVEQLTDAINAVKKTIQPGITKDQRSKINAAIKRLAGQRQKIKPKAASAQEEIGFGSIFEEENPVRQTFTSTEALQAERDAAAGAAAQPTSARAVDRAAHEAAVHEPAIEELQAEREAPGGATARQTAYDEATVRGAAQFAAGPDQRKAELEAERTENAAAMRQHSKDATEAHMSGINPLTGA